MPLTVAALRTRLNKTTTVDDVELQDMLDAAIAYYARVVGPTVNGSVRLDGGPVLILPRNITSLTSITYSDGTTVPVASVDFEATTGLLRHPFRRGARNVTVDFTTAVPVDHQEVILADVAGYFAATQRGGSPGALPGVGYESGLEDRSSPVVLFPRIAALAKSYAKVG